MAVELTTFQWIVLILFVLMYIHYLVRISYETDTGDLKAVEGFASQREGFGDLEKTDALYTWMTDPGLIYDDTYAEIYDQLTLGHTRLAAETALCVKAWTAEDQSHRTIGKWSVLDVGCGSGLASAAFAKMGAGSVVGLDMSPAMLRRAAANLEENKELSDEQKSAITWRQDNAYNVSACSLGEFSHVVVFYFSLY